MPPSAVVPPSGQSHYFAPKIIRVVRSSDEAVRLRNRATRTITLAVRAMWIYRKIGLSDGSHLWQAGECAQIGWFRDISRWESCATAKISRG
jgi:hypothetical protein